MPRLLRRIDVREVSLVNRPANRRRFAIVKQDTTRKEGSIMTLQDLREGVAAIREALRDGHIEAVEDGLNALEEMLEAGLSEEDEAQAPRRRVEEDDADEDETPRQKAETKAEARLAELAEALVQKSAGTSRPLTKAQAVAMILRHHPELWAAHDKEYYATRR